MNSVFPPYSMLDLLHSLIRYAKFPQISVCKILRIVCPNSFRLLPASIFTSLAELFQCDPVPYGEYDQYDNASPRSHPDFIPKLHCRISRSVGTCDNEQAIQFANWGQLQTRRI